MINVLIFDSGRFREKNKARLISYSAIGHTKSEICNAVSVVTQSAANFLMNLATQQSKETVAKYMFDVESGAITVDIAAGDRQDEQYHHALSVIVEMLAYSLDNIQLNYRDAQHITIEKLMDLDDCVSVADCVDCVHEWRRSFGIKPENMRPMERMKG